VAVEHRGRSVWITYADDSHERVGQGTGFWQLEERSLGTAPIDRILTAAEDLQRAGSVVYLMGIGYIDGSREAIEEQVAGVEEALSVIRGDMNHVDWDEWFPRENREEEP